MDRLQKILSRAGIASRRASEQLILAGRVTVNGVTVRALGTKADVTRDDIRVDGRRVRAVPHHRYVLLNKPRGYVSTRTDPQRRPTVLDLVRDIREYIYPVGRLDFDSEGLLLLTSDGDLAARLMHPRHGVPRVYHARVLGIPDEHDLERLRRGMVIDGAPTAPVRVRVAAAGPRQRSAHGEAGAGARAERSGPAPRRRTRDSRSPGSRPPVAARTETTLLEIELREGRNRQVRKMCDAIGHPVVHLARVAIGPIRDSRLKAGEWRELSEAEIARLRAAPQQPRRTTAGAADR